MLVQNEMTLTENLMKCSAQFVNTRYNLTFNNVKWKVYSKSVFNQEPWLLAWHIYLSSLKKMVGYGATGGTYQEGPALFFFSNRGKGQALVLFYFFCFLVCTSDFLVTTKFIFDSSHSRLCIFETIELTCKWSHCASTLAASFSLCLQLKWCNGKGVTHTFLVLTCDSLMWLH